MLQTLQRQWLRTTLAFLLLFAAAAATVTFLHHQTTKAATTSFKETLGSHTYIWTQQKASSLSGKTANIGTWDITDNGTDLGTISGSYSYTDNGGSTTLANGNSFPNETAKASLTGTGTLAEIGTALSTSETSNPASAELTSDSTYNSAISAGDTRVVYENDITGHQYASLHCKGSDTDCGEFGADAQGVVPLGLLNPDLPETPAMNMYNGMQAATNGESSILKAENILTGLAATRGSAMSPVVVPLVATTPKIAPALVALVVTGLVVWGAGASIHFLCGIGSARSQSNQNCLGASPVFWTVLVGIMVLAGTILTGATLGAMLPTGFQAAIVAGTQSIAQGAYQMITSMSFASVASMWTSVATGTRTAAMTASLGVGPITVGL
jgi:hypothetical protein